MAEDRVLITISDHFMIYKDDPYKLIYRDASGKFNWIRFASKQFADANFSTVEQDALKELRPLYNSTNEELDKAAIQSVVMKYFTKASGYFPDSDEQPATKKETKSVPAKKESKQTFTATKGSQTALAKMAGIESDLADMFFMKLDGTPYIKVAGLQFIAGRKGYSRIEITDEYDKEKQEWRAEAKIYPKLDVKTIEALAKLDSEVQKEAFREIIKPTNGLGTASKANVRMTTMHTFLREMAQTRALGRALRAFTSYGATVYEEMPEAQIERD